MWLAPIAIADIIAQEPFATGSGNVLAVGDVIAEVTFAAAPDVAPAMEEAEIHIAVASNDPGYTGGTLWGMLGDTGPMKNAYGSQANEAWADGDTGSMTSVVGVIDTGIDYTHPDLYLNIWLNQREIPTTIRARLNDIDTDGLITFRDLNGAANASYVMDYNRNGRIDAGDLLNDRRWENGTDEDGNGYRDDLIGWDFVSNDNDPFDDNGHGTHVAGTIGAMGGNGIGVAGVNWSIQMVGLKFLSATGSGATTGAINAVNYFTDAAIRATGVEDFIATNNSWGGGGYSAQMNDAIGRAAQKDILFIAAAGNSALNNDVQATYPANYTTTAIAGYEAVVSVASLTNTGGLSSFSNYGATTVDIAAPGSSIYSTLPGGRYGTYSGTSMATPHVTGAVALYAAENPDASAAEIRAALLGSAAATPSLGGMVATGGRLDIGALMDTSPTLPTPMDVIAGNAATATSLTVSASQASSIDFGGDQDWFRLTLTTGWRYSFAMDAAAGSSLDPLLRLLTATGQQLAFNDDGSGLNARLSFNVTTSGTYFLSAQGDAASTGRASEAVRKKATHRNPGKKYQE
jgi:subtilisin family serine protease